MAEYTCPSCRQPIHDDEALSCHFCGESLGRSSSGALGAMKNRNRKWLFVFIVLLVISSLIIIFS